MLSREASHHTISEENNGWEATVSKAKVIFYQCNQDSQEYGSDDEYIVSRIFFTLEIGEEGFKKAQ